MNKQDIIHFFDSCAPHWDANMVRNESAIDAILNAGRIREGIDVLDVACGTGVLFRDYLKRNVGTLTGIDISPKMVEVAKHNFPDVNVICGDVEETDFEKGFDAIMIYNAFPHFPDPEKLIRCLSKLLNKNGTLTVAHGMSRTALQHHHSGAASCVSIDLLHEDKLADIFTQCGLNIQTKISDEEKYIVSGILP